MRNIRRRFSSGNSNNQEGTNSSDASTPTPKENRGGLFSRMQAKLAGTRVSEHELEDAIKQGLNHDSNSYQSLRDDYKNLRNEAQKVIKWINKSEQTLLVNKIDIATELVSENTTLKQSMALIDNQILDIQIGKNGLGCTVYTWVYGVHLGVRCTLAKTAAVL